MSVEMEGEGRLFEVPPAWAEHWEGMPEFEQVEDQRAHGGSIRVYFRTDEDRAEFLKLAGAPAYRQAGFWYPYRSLPDDRYEGQYDPAKVRPNRYPIYIISKGRPKFEPGVKWGAALTYAALDQLGIDYRIVVEPQERDEYAAHIAEEKILVLPFSNLGQGSIPARNWVWEHAVESGADRHWILDDNIKHFARINRNRDKIVKDENPLVPCEDFVDRYRNVGLAGLQKRGFADAKHPDLAPYRLNTRIYSCILVNHDLPFRWRGRYNEDTDLSLRVLKAGWVTVLFQCYTVDKKQTMMQSGGNTDELYAGNGRRLMAESLREQHPDVASVTEKWGRPQHHVDYSPFRHNKLQLRQGSVV